MSVFIYLIGRNKKDLKIIAALKGNCPARRIKNIKNLQLPQNLEQQIENIIYNNRMNYEAWIESATSVQDLTKSLSKRGHKQFPMTYKILLHETSTLDPIVTKKIKITSLHEAF